MNPVLADAQFISQHSKDVSISKEGVIKAAHELIKSSKSGTPFNFEDWHAHPLNPGVDVKPVYQLHWCIIVDALNFSFWSDLEIKLPESVTAIEYIKKNKFGVVYKDRLYQGYWALPALINRALDSNIPLLDFSKITQMSDSDLLNIFHSDYSTLEPYPPMVYERVRVLRETAQVIVSKFDNSGENLIAQAEQSALKLMTLLTQNFSSFNDVANFDNKVVSFQKRAQIFVADIWACFQGKGYGTFNDIDKITMFADYRVPQALVHLGVLEYSEELKNGLSKKLESGDRWEIEIRGNSIWGVELMCQTLKSLTSENDSEAHQIHWNPILIDFYLWEYAKYYPKELKDIPIHRVRSCFY